MLDSPPCCSCGLPDQRPDQSCSSPPYRLVILNFVRPDVLLSHFEFLFTALKPSRNDVPDGRNTSLGAQRAFPDRRNPPAGLQQSGSNGTVPLYICTELQHPELRACCRSACVTAARMPMPEAPVHEDDGPVFRQHKIRLARYALGMEAISEAQRVQGTPEGQFRLRILSADPGHHPGTGLAVDDVGHLPPGLGRWAWYTANVPNSRGL